MNREVPMSFQPQDFSVVAYANGFTHWHYRTRDPLDRLLETVDGANDNAYFAAAGEMLRPGDQITVTLISPDRHDLASLVVAALPQPSDPQLALIATSRDASRQSRAA
jgi:hypothetical protein